LVDFGRRSLRRNLSRKPKIQENEQKLSESVSEDSIKVAVDVLNSEKYYTSKKSSKNQVNTLTSTDSGWISGGEFRIFLFQYILTIIITLFSEDEATDLLTISFNSGTYNFLSNLFPVQSLIRLE